MQQHQVVAVTCSLALSGKDRAVTTEDGDITLFDGQQQLRACRATQVGR